MINFCWSNLYNKLILLLLEEKKEDKKKEEEKEEEEEDEVKISIKSIVTKASAVKSCV